MIGLTFLAIGLLWLAFSIFVGRKLPRWLGIRNPAGQWAVTVAAVAVLLVGPFVDHIVGMWQFERLCGERAIIWTSADAKTVTKARRGETRTIILPSLWIVIRSQQTEYVNIDTGKPFLKHEMLYTKGGHLGGLLRLGNDYSCAPSIPNAMNELNIDKLIEQGKS